jgi:hypothetical protein
MQNHKIIVNSSYIVSAFWFDIAAFASAPPPMAKALQVRHDAPDYLSEATGADKALKIEIQSRCRMSTLFAGFSINPELSANRRGQVQPVITCGVPGKRVRWQDRVKLELR